MIKFITYLSGSADWNQFAPALEPSYTPLPQWAVDLLGTTDAAMCACLYRLYRSKPQYAGDLLYTDETSVGAKISALQGGTLCLDGQGAASVKPSQPPFVGDKMCLTTPVLHCSSAGTATVTVGAYEETVTCNHNGGIVEVAWPSWLRLHGTVKVDSLPATVRLPIVWTYPVDEVDRRIRRSSAAYTFMETYDVVGLFYTESTAEGRLCAFLRAALKHVNYLH